MSTTKIDMMREVLEYNADRAYFGELTGTSLGEAYRIFKKTHDWEKPVIKTTVRVGEIDGTVICRTLWNEMSYNPLRFGHVSPFAHNGNESIYHFCSKDLPEDIPAFKTLFDVHYNLREFMFLNANPTTKQWQDKVTTDAGMVDITLINGHSDDKYKMLSALRETVRCVISQNLKDLKRKPYRIEMAKVIQSRHPDGTRGMSVAADLKRADAIIAMKQAEKELAADRLDCAEENAQITADNARYFSTDQYEQAKEDLEKIQIIRNSQNNK